MLRLNSFFYFMFSKITNFVRILVAIKDYFKTQCRKYKSFYKLCITAATELK